MKHVGSVLQYVGGRIGAVAASGIVFGVFTIVAGATPGEVVASFFENPPPWLPWASPTLIILGLVIIWASLHFNIWSQRQKAIDALAEDISRAISDLVNRKVSSNEEIETFSKDFNSWCNAVREKLENRAFFTRADQLHFDRLGYLEPITMQGHRKIDHIHTMLKFKLERLRDIINWSQQRKH